MNINGSSLKSSEKTIQEHLRHYYSLLRSGREFPVSALIDTYLRFNPSLHLKAGSSQIDYTVLNYCLPRLPHCLFRTKKIIICQSKDQLLSTGYNLDNLELVTASARRRLCYYDKLSQTLAVLVSSDSDLDDLVNCLVAFQIERKKITSLSPRDLADLINPKNFWSSNTEVSDWHDYQDIIILPALAADDNLYRSIASNWWQKICTNSLIFEFTQTPIYFISSNLHSFSNLIGGYVNQKQDQIISHTEKHHPDLYTAWQKIKTGQNQLRVIDFLYYISSRYFIDLPGEQINKAIYEDSLGIKIIKSDSELVCNAQLIPVSAIVKSNYRDPNLAIPNPTALLNSRAYILNIDYPLGFSAYFLIRELLATLEKLKGVYIIGKAAILSGAIGDIQIPKLVFDERTNNIFYPDNIFNKYFPFTTFQSSILKDQKSISVYGTFLENETQLNNYINSDFNIIEMESGPYLTAICQHHLKLPEIPHTTVAHLDNLPFDLGIINYASDNPLSKNLGEGSLSLKGIEPTYLAALSVLQRIIDLESV